jgi:hypothetical protein
MRLHKVTWLIVFAAAIHLAADLIESAHLLRTLIYQGASAAAYGDDGRLSLTLARMAHMLALSLSYVASAATVEFLSRIWRELVLARQARTKV